MTNLSPAIEHALEHMRQAIVNEPEILLETFGGPRSHGEHVFADFYGFEEELVAGGVLMPESRPVWLMPIRPSLRRIMDDWRDASTTEAAPVLSTLRTAQYDRLSCFATCAVSPELAPGWPYDKLTYQVKLMLIRYRRTR